MFGTKTFGATFVKCLHDGFDRVIYLYCKLLCLFHDASGPGDNCGESDSGDDGEDDDGDDDGNDDDGDDDGNDGETMMATMMAKMMVAMMTTMMMVRDTPPSNFLCTL